jgi:hypothetical protein
MRRFLLPLVFGALVAAYVLCHAPFGLNETDGGFLSGLGWRIAQGQMLYKDVLYVRPPWPVWVRAWEMQWLPDVGAVLAERAVFYLKLALYSLMAAALLASGPRRWWLAMFGFVLSAHHYPAAAWHTVEGILWAVAALWAWVFGARRWPRLGALAAGLCLLLALLCKQSFYPLALAFPAALLLFEPKNARLGWFFAGLGLGAGAFALYLTRQGIWSDYLQLTGAAASGGQALQHGGLDYFRINPRLLLCSAALLPAVGWFFWKKRLLPAYCCWCAWLLALGLELWWATWQRVEFSVPFGQARLLFWVAALHWAWGAATAWRSGGAAPSGLLRLGLLLAIAWCSAVSWGYNLPLLFVTPAAYAVWETSRRIQPPHLSFGLHKYLNVMALGLLLLCFAVAGRQVYRDGPRTAMHTPMGDVFPALQGLRSSAESAALYRDLRALHQRHGDNLAVLPAFPQAAWLLGIRPPLPLDWVVRREMGGREAQVWAALERHRPVLLLEKAYAEKLRHDPELALVQQMRQRAVLLEETPFFWVLRYE